ncbi:MAG: hypothetical protein QOJ25_2866, partial [Solirubrobacteraceae bacterium]|nr:hypothetical protein [Solirubrobacteraceae bacterium]
MSAVGASAPGRARKPRQGMSSTKKILYSILV